MAPVTGVDVVALAAAEVGYREAQLPNGTWSNKNKFGREFGADGVAWCHIFVSIIARHAGVRDKVPQTAWCPSGLKFFRDRDLTGHFPPRAGDIGYLIQGSHVPHVFYVEKWIDSLGMVQTIEGNTNTNGSAQGNGVYRLRRPDSEDNTGIVYARPKYS
jgi:hypothetical protein